MWVCLEPGDEIERSDYYFLISLGFFFFFFSSWVGRMRLVGWVFVTVRLLLLYIVINTGKRRL